jgi:hypothetical protein
MNFYSRINESINDLKPKKKCFVSKLIVQIIIDIIIITTLIFMFLIFSS